METTSLVTSRYDMSGRNGTPAAQGMETSLPLSKEGATTGCNGTPATQGMETRPLAQVAQDQLVAMERPPLRAWKPGE